MRRLTLFMGRINSHAEILAGGELHFQMGSKPDKEWASAPANRPLLGSCAPDPLKRKILLHVSSTGRDHP